MVSDSLYLPLLDLLRQRRDLIADHAWRDQDTSGHLAGLQQISEAVMAEHVRLRPQIPPRLQHYLTQCSYDKAAAWIESGGEA